MSEVKLYLGDCLEILPTLEDGSVDAVITDPPYLDGDYSYMLPLFEQLLRNQPENNILLTPGKLESWNWIKVKKPYWEYCWQVNSKSLGGSACFHIGWEPILAYSPPIKPLGNDVLNYPINRPDQNNGHPHPKPLNLFRFLVVRWTNPGDTILDPFMGSGTTGVACVQTGRNFIGIEIEPKYYKIAEKRIKEAQLQLRLGI